MELNWLLDFVALSETTNFSRAAETRNITQPAFSRRIRALEKRVGAALVERTTHSVALTPSGKQFLAHAKTACLSLEQARREAIDLSIRFGGLPNSRIRARRLQSNRRFLCAAPSYLEKHGTPRNLADLINNNCIILRQDKDVHDVWKLQRGQHSETVKVHGTLSSNDGEIALGWVLDGHGIMLRSEWDIARHVDAKRLHVVLPQYAHVDADIYAVYPERHNLSAKVTIFIDFLHRKLRQNSKPEEDEGR